MKRRGEKRGEKRAGKIEGDKSVKKANSYKVDAVPGFGELMLASNPSSPHFDPTFWYSSHHPSLPLILPASLPAMLSLALFWLNNITRWLSEKYDGVRAFFNPYTRVVYLTILDLYN